MRELSHVRVESDAFPSTSVHVFELRGSEAISRLFEFQIDLVCTTASGLDDHKILGATAELVFELGETEVRRVFGMVSAIRDTLHSETQRRAYTLTFVPRTASLGLSELSEVFLDKSVPDIVRDVLTRAGFAERDDFELRLHAPYAPREFVVQYKETTLAFISRLCEHLGISFWVEHDTGTDKLVFGDDNSAFRPIDGAEHVPFYARGEHLGVFHLDAVMRLLPANVTVQDYNYRTPKVSLRANTSVEGGRASEVVEYGIHAKTPDEARRLAQIRAEERACALRVFEGKSSVQTMMAGARATVEGHPRGDTELLLVEVVHRAQQPVLGAGPDERTNYTNAFRAIEASRAFRPPRITPKPRVAGAITGVVEAEQRGEYAEVDEAGRYRVRFAFDRGEHAHGRASHPIRMAQPHAGPGYGMHFPLRDGVEVVITCIEGDPDRPIIAGAVPNPVTPSPVTSKNAPRNVIRTGGGTELNIDDSDGSTRFKITVPFGGTVFQLGAPNEPTPGIAMLTGEKALVSAKGNIDVLSESDITISAGPNVNISAETLVDVDAARVELTGADSLTTEAPATTIKGSLVNVHGNGMTFVHGAQGLGLSSRASVTVDAGARFAVVAPGGIELTGASSVKTTPHAEELVGNKYQAIAFEEKLVAMSATHIHVKLDTWGSKSDVGGMYYQNRGTEIKNSGTQVNSVAARIVRSAIHILG